MAEALAPEVRPFLRGCWARRHAPSTPLRDGLSHFVLLAVAALKDEGEPVRFSDLPEVLGIRTAALVPLVRDLEARGLLEARRIHGFAPKTLLRLTVAGQTAVLIRDPE